VTSKAGIFTNEANFDKPNDGKGLFSMTLNTIIPCSSLPYAVRQWPVNISGCLEDNSTYSGPIAFCKIMAGDGKNPCNPRKNNIDFYAWQQTTPDEISRKMTTSNIGVTIYRHKNVKPQAYQAYFMLQNPIVQGQLPPEASAITVVPIKGVTFENTGEGGVYAMIVTGKDQPEQDYQFTVHTIVYQNQVNILWQLPQYFVITFAEILISITGIEFAYSQAAPSMKSVVQAIWLFTVALGDLIIILITLIEGVFHQHLEIEMFVYAALMVVVMFIFILLAIFYYEYADYSHQSNGELAERKTTDTNSTETEE